MEKKQARAERLDAEGRCIVCEEKVETRRLGLCMKDYQRYRRVVVTLSPEQKAMFDQELIANGELLPSRQGKRPNVRNVFEERLNQLRESGFRLGSEFPATEDEAELDRQMAAEAEAARARRKANQPRKQASRKRKSG